MTHLDSGTPSSTFKLDTSLGTLHDQSMPWILNAYHDINKEELIMKAFELCHVGEFNLSHTYLMSVEALSALHQLPITNPSLHHEITGGKTSRCTEDDEPVFSAKTDQGDGR
ncbi:hypothetical protein PILCRDRAFT_9444 [Piloderma croceum F 1598]|uniref:Uncharacterized protein n=1 Tax=Piloderma croceum (strain F 1598) TaxID=765440 RepID=A0A0C3FN21_PILCF|nr:hypothetical protein PILCRDRAFT_9444 [Piloderma croceum F 1598]